MPPQLYFPKELRRKHNIDNLLTIPVHADRNLSYQLDEEYFVRTLLPMTRGSEAGDAHHLHISKKLKAGKNVRLHKHSESRDELTSSPLGFALMMTALRHQNT